MLWLIVTHLLRFSRLLGVFLYVTWNLWFVFVFLLCSIRDEMTKDQLATPIPEELYNLTQLANVTLAAGPLSTAAKGSNMASNSNVFYASSDDDSTYNSYSHKVFDRRKLRRSTISDSNSCASITSSSSSQSSEQSANQAAIGSGSSSSGSLLEDEHICPECGKKYSTSSNLARHRQTHR